ncbi:hypothetical protein NL676_030665 [Syzygium grande]|nr:hypothetical protein NL676_030665 [Syzygium grande]
MGGVEMESRKAEEWASQLQCWALQLINCFAFKPEFLPAIYDWQYMAIDCLLWLLQDPNTSHKVVDEAVPALADLSEITALGDHKKLGDSIVNVLEECIQLQATVTPIFLSLLRLKYGGAGASPSRTHPRTMGFSIAYLLASYLAFLLNNEYLPDSSLPSAYGQALEPATLLLGSLSLVSLVTLLLPSSWTTYSYVVYIFLSMAVGAPMCSMLFKCKLSTSSETGTVYGILLLSSALSVDQETDLPV